MTEDDVNEIKNDISAFRFEMIEIMRASGMNTQSASGPSGWAILFMKNIVKLPTHGIKAYLASKRRKLLFLNPEPFLTNSNYFSGPGGKKNRQKERRLMKGFNISTQGRGGQAAGSAAGGQSNNGMATKAGDLSQSSQIFSLESSLA